MTVCLGCSLSGNLFTSAPIRIENGDVGLSVTDARALMRHYEVPPVESARVVELARASRGPHWARGRERRKNRRIPEANPATGCQVSLALCRS